MRNPLIPSKKEMGNVEDHLKTNFIFTCVSVSLLFPIHKFKGKGRITKCVWEIYLKIQIQICYLPNN